MMTHFDDSNFFPTLNQKVNFDSFVDSFAKFGECLLMSAIKFVFKCFDLS